MTEQTTFGEESPPELTQKGSIKHPTQPASIIGYFCWNKDKDKLEALLVRNREEHFFRKYDGYAISESVIEKLTDKGVTDVHILEDDEALLTYGVEDYINGERIIYDTREDTIIPSLTNGEEDGVRYDPQRVVSEEEATKWEDFVIV